MNFGPVESIIFLAIVVLWLAGQWRVFAKAGHPGWATIVPIYNLYVWIKIAGHSGWWLLLYLIPLVGTVAHLIISIDAARAFGENAIFGFGMWLVPCRLRADPRVRFRDVRRGRLTRPRCRLADWRAAFLPSSAAPSYDHRCRSSGCRRARLSSSRRT